MRTLSERLTQSISHSITHSRSVSEALQLHSKLRHIDDILKERDGMLHVASSNVQQDKRTMNELPDFVFILDCVQAFSKMCKLYFEDEKKASDWYAQQINKQLMCINATIDEIANCISLDAEQTDVELQLPVDAFDGGKHIATLIKTTDEYKQFKKLIRTYSSKLNFDGFDLQLRSLSIICIKQSKELIRMLS